MGGRWQGCQYVIVRVLILGTLADVILGIFFKRKNSIQEFCTQLFVVITRITLEISAWAILDSAFSLSIPQGLRFSIYLNSFKCFLNFYDCRFSCFF